METRRTAEATQYVYHVVQEPFVGTWVIPLNRMPAEPNFEGTYKIIYDKARLRYRGRESIMEDIVPPLNCKWNDVSFFSPIDPRYIFAEYQANGLPVERFNALKFFKIPASRLRAKTTAIWLWNEEKKDFKTPTVYQSFDPSTYQEMNGLPEAAKEHVREYKEQRNKGLWLFFGIPHVMTTSKVDVSDVERVDWRTPSAKCQA